MKCAKESATTFNIIMSVLRLKKIDRIEMGKTRKDNAWGMEN